MTTFTQRLQRLKEALRRLLKEEPAYNPEEEALLTAIILDEEQET